MALDPSIALQVRAPQFESPVNALAQMLQAQGLQQQNQLSQYQLQRAQQADADRNALAEVWKTGVRPDGTVDQRTVLQNAASRGLGAQIPGLQKGFADEAKSAAEAKKVQYETALQKIDLGSRILSTARDEGSYQQARQQIQATLGPEAAAQMPNVYDPAVIQGLMNQGLSIKDRLQAEHQALTLQETGRHNVATEGMTAQQIAEAGRHNRTSEGISAGNLGVAQANLGISRERLSLEKTAPKGVLDTERGLLVDPRNGEAIPITQGGVPVGAKKPTEGQQKVTDAKEVLTLLNEAETILPKATSSMAGAARDKVFGAVGASTEGAQGAAQLKALQGALVSKMPKMSGPQSDKDVLLYREMAGQIGDATIPTQTRQAAIDTIRRLNEKYAGVETGSSKPNAGRTVKRTGTLNGRKVVEYSDGTTDYAD